MEDRLTELPKGWVWTRFGEISRVMGGKRLPKGHVYSETPTNYPYIRVTDFENMNVNMENLLFLKPETQKIIQRYVISKEDIYISIAGSIGKVGLIPEKLDGANLTENAAKITSIKGVEKKFLCHYLNSTFSQQQISRLTISSNQPKLALFRIEQIIFPLPPLPEQHRIVAKIEELFTKLDAGVEALKKVKEQLKRYRQAVLKYAFEGKLTNENMVEGQLPDGWKLFPIGKVVKTIDGDRGPNYPKKNEFFEKGHCLFLSTKNVREDRFVFKENIFISKEKDEILRGGKLQLNDVVITTRGTLGNVALYDDRVPFKNVRINSGMLILRVINPMLNNYYLMKFVSSPLFIKQLKGKQSGTAQPQIPANVLREIQLPIPPTLEEQENIFAEIESHLSVCDKIEESIENSLKQSETLRQSILKQAFEGKLVPQDPTDEPAEKLLERIKEEKERQEAENKTEKKHKSKKTKQMELI